MTSLKSEINFHFFPLKINRSFTESVQKTYKAIFKYRIKLYKVVCNKKKVFNKNTFFSTKTNISIFIFNFLKRFIEKYYD